MATFYLLYNPISKEYAKSGRLASVTYSLNLAKHFTSAWSAQNYRASHRMFDSFSVYVIGML